MAEQFPVQALPVFPEAGELRQAKTQRRVVAQRAEIAEMVRHPLALQQQGAQPGRAR